MYLMVLGFVLLVMKWLEFEPVALWSWWLVLLPFVLAVVWWQWADYTGYTKRKAMEHESKKCEERRARIKDNLSSINRNRR